MASLDLQIDVVFDTEKSRALCAGGFACCTLVYQCTVQLPARTWSEGTVAAAWLVMPHKTTSFRRTASTAFDDAPLIGVARFPHVLILSSRRCQIFLVRSHFPPRCQKRSLLRVGLLEAMSSGAPVLHSSLVFFCVWSPTRELGSSGEGLLEMDACVAFPMPHAEIRKSRCAHPLR